MYDSDYCGLAERENVVCKHNSIAAKFVCFEGYNTGRRFLACAGQVCANCCVGNKQSNIEFREYMNCYCI